MRVFDDKEDIRKIAEDTVNQQIAENDGKIPEWRNFFANCTVPILQK